MSLGTSRTTLDFSVGASTGDNVTSLAAILCDVNWSAFFDRAILRRSTQSIPFCKMVIRSFGAFVSESIFWNLVIILADLVWTSIDATNAHFSKLLLFFGSEAYLIRSGDGHACVPCTPRKDLFYCFTAD